MKKGKFFKTLAVFGACLGAPLLLTGCQAGDNDLLKFRVQDGYVQYTKDGKNWENIVSSNELKGEQGKGIKRIMINNSQSDATKTTYIIVFDDNTTYSYVVKNGTNGSNGEDGEDGSVVTIGEDGYWYIDGVKTDVKAKGEDGSNGSNGTNGVDGQDGKDGNGIKSITINQANSDATKTTYIITFDDNTTYSYEVKNGVNGSNGKDGEDGSVVTIGEDGYWYIDGVKTDVKAKGEDGSNGTNGTDGEDGEDGKDGNGIKSITIDQANSDSTKTTYIITFDDNTTYSFEVINGTNGKDGVDGEDGKDAVIDTYTITYDYGAADTFFAEVKETETIKATQWLTTLPEINEEYKDSFLGWFISGTEKQIKNYDFIGGNVTLEARFDIKIASSGLYQNGKYVKTWADIFEEYPNAIVDNTIKVNNGTDSYFKNLVGELVIDDSIIKIQQHAFFNCDEITAVVIPSSVTNIEYTTSAVFDTTPFSNCAKLNMIEVKEGNPVYHSNGNCLIETGTKWLIAGSNTSVIPTDGSVTTIGDYAFYGSGIVKITIPEGVEYVCGNAFSSCINLEEVIISSSVRDIKYATPDTDAPFSNCAKLSRIEVEEGNTIYKSGGNCLIEIETKTLIAGSIISVIPTDGSVTTIGADAFYGRSELTEIVIPTSVTKIEEQAFSNCIGLIKISVDDGNSIYHSVGNCIIETATKTLIEGCKTSVIPTDGSVTSIEPYAFYLCGGLTKIIIPEGVTKIGGYAFYKSGLEEVVIPSSIQYINGFSLDYCSDLIAVYYKGTSSDWSDVQKSYIKNVYYYLESEPTASGNYWHYDSDGVTPIIW